MNNSLFPFIGFQGIGPCCCESLHRYRPKPCICGQWLMGLTTFALSVVMKQKLSAQPQTASLSGKRLSIHCMSSYCTVLLEKIPLLSVCRLDKCLRLSVCLFFTFPDNWTWYTLNFAGLILILSPCLILCLLAETAFCFLIF